MKQLFTFTILVLLLAARILSIPATIVPEKHLSYRPRKIFTIF